MKGTGPAGPAVTVLSARWHQRVPRAHRKVSGCCCRLQLPSLLLCCRVQSCPKATTSRAVNKGVLNPRREYLQCGSPFTGPAVPRESQRLAMGGVSEKQKRCSVWPPAHAWLPPPVACRSQQPLLSGDSWACEGVA